MVTIRRSAVPGTGARAISSVDRPPTARGVSATWASTASAGWQHMSKAYCVSGSFPRGPSSSPVTNERRPEGQFPRAS
jgi:hypothetical protein